MQVNITEWITVEEKIDNVEVNISTTVTNGMCSDLNMYIYDDDGTEISAYFANMLKITSGKLMKLVATAASRAFSKLEVAVSKEIELQQEALRRLEGLGLEPTVSSITVE